MIVQVLSSCYLFCFVWLSLSIVFIVSLKWEIDKHMKKPMSFLFLSRSKITRACDEKEHCNLYASNDVFGNPCPVISSKYIYIKYSCE